MRARNDPKRLMLRVLSFGLLGITFAALILAERTHIPDDVIAALLPVDTPEIFNIRLLLCGFAAISVLCCVGIELTLRRHPPR